MRPAFPIGTRFWNQGSSLESCKDAGAARRLLVACALLVACGLLVACALLVASEMLHRVALLASCALGLQRGPRFAPARRRGGPRLGSAAARDGAPCVVVVTHAAGRMGTSLVAQLHESWELLDPPPWASAGDLVVRAVVRDDDEATRLKIDLGGLVLRDNKAVPLLDTSTWLDVRVVPDGGENEGAALAAALDGAAACVLCSAAHAGFEVAGGGDGGGAGALVPGSIARAKAERAFAGGSPGINVRVPRAEAEQAGRRLLREIGAVGAAVDGAGPGATLRHVVLRSSMGVHALGGVRGATAVADADVLALARMGGEEAVRAHAAAEDALRSACGSKVGTTVVRLGALTDDAGGVPLEFGSGDRQLVDRVSGDAGDGVAASEPPLVSRNDAARLLMDVVRRGLPKLDHKVFDAAWKDKFGAVSAGTLETALTAAGQDLIEGAAKAAVPA